jgi:hypothetical protein
LAFYATTQPGVDLCKQLILRRSLDVVDDDDGGIGFARFQLQAIKSIQERQRQWGMSRGIDVAPNGRLKSLDVFVELPAKWCFE